MKIFPSYKKILLTSITLLIPIVTALVIILMSVASTSASTQDNVTGYANSANTGSISMNCVNDGSCSMVDYGVNVRVVGSAPSGTGESQPPTGIFSGEAWSPNVGWITFGANGCGPSPVMNMATGVVTGWARAISPTQNPWTGPSAHGNWTGCIHMSGNTQSGGTYGVIINPTTGIASGYAWNGDDVSQPSGGSGQEGSPAPDIGMGWINFSGVRVTLPSNASIIIDTNPNFVGPCGLASVVWPVVTGVNGTSCKMNKNGVFDQNVNTTTQTGLNYTISATSSFVLKCNETANPNNIISSNTLVLGTSCLSAPECSDISDNDNDNHIDQSDASCHTDCNASNISSYTPLSNDESAICIIGTSQCNDGADNDNDNRIDQSDSSCHTDCVASNASSYNPSYNDETRVCVINPDDDDENDENDDNDNTDDPGDPNDPNNNGSGGKVPPIIIET